MTDEEMAEKYAVEKWEHCEEGQTNYKALKLAFLAGLKAGKPQWHDLREDSDDLPPRKGLETYSSRVITDKGYGMYNFRKCRWYVDEPDCGFMVHTEVIAWCELSEFKEGV